MLLRSLLHYRKVNLAVVLGAAVATAVLTGALLVGDSVRGSLRALTLDRLGAVDVALVRDGFFRDRLGDDLAASASDTLAAAAPLILLQGSAVHADSGTRASKVALHGIDGRFAGFFPGAGGGPAVVAALPRADDQLFPSVVVNAALAGELGAAVGDTLLLRSARQSDVPRDTLMGDKDPEDVLATLRVTLTAIVPDKGIGRFGLTTHQLAPRNAFVELRTLQRAVGQDDRVNGLVLAAAGPTDTAVLDAALQSTVRLEDLGLRLERRRDHVSLESREFVFRPAIEEMLPALDDQREQRVQVYLANTIRAGEREIPYSMVAAVDPLERPRSFTLRLESGEEAPPLPHDAVYLGRWAAEDLGAQAGDTVELDYFVVGAGEELRTESATFRVAGVVAHEGLAADAGLTPEYPGIQDADDISDWDPPFPVDLDRIRPRDEDYWDRYRATPKLFLAPETGRRLWQSRFGTTTSVRYPAAGSAWARGADLGPDLHETVELLRERLLEPELVAALGFELRDVRADGLRGAVGATDFSGLFIAFSFFIIISSALLCGLLFRLSVEQRAREIGLLLAVGFGLRAVRLARLGEGGVLAALGATLGIGGGVAYAWLMLVGLRTLWVEAVGSTELTLHVQAGSLVLGWLISVVFVLVAIAGTIWRLGRIPCPALLAGSLTQERRAGKRRIAPWLAWGGGLAGLGMLATAVIAGRTSDPALAFGTGFALLVAGLAWFAMWCRGSRGRSLGRGAMALYGMAARNSAWNPGRSMLSVALVASACFVIVTVAANRQQHGEELREKESATGGFSLLAESDVPLHQHLDRARARFDLGFSDEDSRRLASTRFYPLRVLPGQDVSCLNLYRPERPTLLGVPEELVERGGFTFAKVDRGLLAASPGVDPAAPWTLLQASLEPGEDGVPVLPTLVDQNSAQWVLHVGLGDELELTDEYGKPVRLRIVGLIKKSVLQSVALVAEERFLEHFPGRTGYGFFLIDAPWDEAEEIARTLESNLGPFGFDAVGTPEKLASFQAVEHTYMSTFEALGGLGLLLGTLGLAVVLVRNVLERRGELATLRAVGFPRASLVRLVLAENAFLLLCGVAVGTLAALLAVAPRLLTLPVSWGGLLGTLGTVLVVGMLASVGAVLGALRIPLLPALKAER
jgi:ABC-type antimicrobial peptide transport system permease subunit